MRPLEDLLVAELPRLRVFAAQLVRGANPPVDPDDLTQEAAARALRYGSSFDRERPLGPWLCKTVLRLYLDRRTASVRDERQRADLGRERVEPSPRLESTLEDRESIARLAARLSAVEFDVLVRFHQRGESLREISAALRIPEGTVKSHLHRARRKLAGGDV